MGYSAALGLELHWDDGNLRLYDPVAQRYLRTLSEANTALAEERAARLAAGDALEEERAARIASDAVAAEERAARIAAEADAQRLREELDRLRSGC